MPWSKGAVVIVKHGDNDIADALSDSIQERMVPKSEMDKLQAQYVIMKKRNAKFWQAEINKAQRKYGYNFVGPKWLQKLREGFALIIYYTCCDRKRFLKIK